MRTHCLLLPDGSRISSGNGSLPALQKVSITQKVNTQQELTCGSVFASILEVTILCPDGQMPLKAGDKVELFQGEEKQGVFYVENPTRTAKGIYKITAYDTLRLLDKDLSTWLAGLTGWPYTLQTFANMVAKECGVNLLIEQNSIWEFQVQAFSGQEITGRMALGWVAQAVGCFCRATQDGKIEFAWYSPEEVVLTPAGETYYYRGSFSREDYQVKPIDQVILRSDSSDVGTQYPNTIAGKNAYVIEGNPLLTAQNAQSLSGVAQFLYEKLCNITYTPCKVTVPSSLDIRPGQIVRVQDGAGQLHSMYVMERRRIAGKDTISCSGSYERDRATVANRTSLKALSGKVLRLRMDVDGLSVKNEDMLGNFAQMELDVAGIRTEVSKSYEKTLSRGEQLITNGTGQMGDNTNFTGVSYGKSNGGVPLTFDSTQCNGTPGSFTYPTPGVYVIALTDEFFPVNATRRFTLSFDARSRDGEAVMYAFFNFYDADRKRIYQEYYNYVSETLTTLAADLNYGDEYVYLTDASQWVNTQSCVNLLFWNYVSDMGHAFAVGTYTRNYAIMQNSSGIPTGIDIANNRVHLKSPWYGNTIPAGTKVSQGRNSGTYKYIVNAFQPLTSWHTYSGFIEGTDYSGQNKSNMFPPGTAYAQVGFLWNYNKADDQLWVTKVSVQDTTELHKLSESITTSSTRISQTEESIKIEAERTTALEESADENDKAIMELSEKVKVETTADRHRITVLEAKAAAGAEKVYVPLVDYSFDKEGLKIAKPNENIANLIDNKGMYVRRKEGTDPNTGEVLYKDILTADATGVEAENVHVRTYLIVGSGDGRSRFEDYGADRTGCFWIGG